MRATRTARAFAQALLIGSLASGMCAAPAHADDTLVDFVVVRTDTLTGLARSVLTSPDAWREVARLNRLPNPNLILPGQHLRIPARLLRGVAIDATLVSVTGADVTAAGAPAVTGMRLAEGESVQTGPTSSAVLVLADGSRVRLPPSSLAELAASRQYGGRLPADTTADSGDSANENAPARWFAGTMRLVRGSVEVFATKVLRAKPLEVVTPTAVVGVRGTQYRVALGDQATRQRTHAEVLEGVVRFDAGAAATGTQPNRDVGAASSPVDRRSGPSPAISGVDLAAGFGAATDAADPTARVAALLDAPDLGAVPERFERPIVRFAVPGNASLRVQVAADAGFDQIVDDQTVAAGAEVRIAGLRDAPWFLRARQVDPDGIEGHDALHSFVLKARPEPPASLAPRSDAKQSVGRVGFGWAANTDAPRARLQIARDPGFGDLVADRDELDAPELSVDFDAPGTYYWRLASIRPDGDHGPFGDPQRFELRPVPEPAAVARSTDGLSLVFRWGGRAQDRHQVEFATDPAFAQIVSRDEVGGTEWTQPLPARGGRYYFRYRSIEPDGFVTPYGETLQVDLPRDWSGLGLLLPLLLLL